MKIYLLGINSFIAKNLYLKLKKTYETIICISHSDHNILEQLDGIDNNDIIINLCGVNRADTYDEYYNGNTLFIQKIINYLGKKKIYPFLIHFSSLMVYGYEKINLAEVPVQQAYFIRSKLECESYLLKNYPNNKLCILRPSNVYGYNCLPYKNNLLVTLMYEKIIGQYKITKINNNCVRNFISIDGVVDETAKIITKAQYGIFNIVTDNYISLNKLVDLIYADSGHVPKDIVFTNDEKSIPDVTNPQVFGTFIVVEENLKKNISVLNKQMIQYYKLIENINRQECKSLVQERGKMIEISDLEGARLYFITITQNMIRGNHYHDIQTEDFYIHKGRVIFLLAHKSMPDIIDFQICEPNCLIRVKPNIIHTLINDFSNNVPEIFITSTQKYIKNSSPDTVYVKIM